ncbi:MAG: DUF982 domain-containing protein [Rhizobiaceae bacterium]
MSEAFDQPVAIRFAGDRSTTVRTPKEAERLLADAGWPVRGPRHRDATETCAKVLGGARSSVDARTAFVAAAREAGVLRKKSDG